MADDGGRVEEKLDRIMEHVVDLKTSLARFEGADLPARVDKLEGRVEKQDQKWAKLAGITAAAGALGGGVMATVAKKLGLTS